MSKSQKRGNKEARKPKSEGAKEAGPRYMAAADFSRSTKSPIRHVASKK